MNNRMYKLMNWPAIEAVVYAESDEPGDILGPHAAGSSTLFQTFLPDTKEVRLRIPDEDKSIKMELVDEAGFYAALKSGKTPAKYEYIAEYSDGHIEKIQDTYRYRDTIPEKTLKAFASGRLDCAYEVMGAHLKTIDGCEGVTFTIWAPNARRVSVVGDFNNWDGRRSQMNRIPEYGVFTLFIPGVKAGDLYYYEIDMKGGVTKTVIDPYSEVLVSDEDRMYRSQVTDAKTAAWTDSAYMKKRSRAAKAGTAPLSICECDLAALAEKTGSKDYRKLAEVICSHAAKLGYTHVELKPLTEYEIEESAGYETIGYFAPTERYGSASDFAALVDMLHSKGIGVIMDWTLAHPSSANYALRRLDGTACYEHEDPRQGIQPQWGTLLFNYGRGEVVSFLRSNAMYWLKEFHLDGLRIDSLASVICLDYGRKSGDWVPNMYGGHENLEALEFFKGLNKQIHSDLPGALMITEDSSAYPRVTADVEDDGLGFDYKWNIGWRDDYTRYIGKDPLFRAGSHNDLTLSMVYCYSDNFILPLNVSGINDTKLSLAYMMTHPGAKLTSMDLEGGEDEKSPVAKMVTALNRFYCANPALYELDGSEEGFEWINCMDAEHCTLSFMRKCSKEDKTLVVVANFAGIDQNVNVGISMPGKYTRVFNTDLKEFGGASETKEAAIYTIDDDVDGRPYYIPVVMPALSLSVFSYAPFDENDREYMLKLQMEAKAKADKAKEEAEKEEAKAMTAQKKAEAEAKKAEEAAKLAEEARVRAEKAYAKANAEQEKAKAALEKAKEAANKAELAAHRLEFTENSMKN